MSNFSPVPVPRPWLLDTESEMSMLEVGACSSGQAQVMLRYVQGMGGCGLHVKHMLQRICMLACPQR